MCSVFYIYIFNILLWELFCVGQSRKYCMMCQCRHHTFVCLYSPIKMLSHLPIRDVCDIIHLTICLNSTLAGKASGIDLCKQSDETQILMDIYHYHIIELTENQRNIVRIQAWFHRFYELEMFLYNLVRSGFCAMILKKGSAQWTALVQNPY